MWSFFIDYLCGIIHLQFSAHLTRILIVRFSSIGDIVLTSPVIRCLALQTDAELHFLTKKSFAHILESSPYLHKIHSIEKEVTEVLPELKKLEFDYIIDLHNNLRSLRLRLALSVKSFSFNKLNIKKWLLVNLKIDRMPDIHIVDRYLETTAALGVKNDGKGLDYFIPETTVLPEDFPTAGNYVAYAVGAAHATKRLPAEKIIETCRKIGRPTVLLGGPGDAETGKQIAAAVGKNVMNYCGKLSLHQSAAAVRDADFVITHDTGMMHIAAAFKKRIISVWGSTVPEFGMTPYLPENEGFSKIIEVKNLGCRPCSKIGFDKCPQGHFRCMQEAKVDIF